MKRGRRRLFKRIFTGILAIVLSVSLNINPLATLAGAVADMHIINKIGILKDNLIYVATHGDVSEVLADDASTPDYSQLEAVIDLLNEILFYEYSGLFYEDGPELEDIRNVLRRFRTENAEALELIDMDLKEMHGMIDTHFGIVESQLNHISEQLDMINQNIDDMQHNYRVAHLYSLNAEFETALWKPYLNEVPYVTDFAQVMGQFAKVYTGYWDTAITEMNRPGGSAADRAKEVLGYDATVRYEGVLLTNEITQTPNVDSQTRNMRVAILGDSISTYAGSIPEEYPSFYASEDVVEETDTWWGKIIADNYTKSGISSYSGCYVLPVGDPDGQSPTTASSDGRIENLKGADGSPPDIILVYLGTNDCNATVVNGSEFVLTKDEEASHTGTKSFESAYEDLLYKLESKYVNAYILCCTIPPQSWGLSGELNHDGLDHYANDYNEVIRSAASKYQCGIIDFASCWDEGSIASYTLPGDGVHPNKAGMEKMSQAAMAGIESSNIIGHMNSGLNGMTVMNKPEGQSGQHESYEMTGTVNPTSLATHYRELIPEHNITWLDAVTVLYKAVGQPLYTYQTFQTYNSRITPETSPAYAGLSNIVPDESGAYQGYDFYMFLNRNNTVSGVVGSEKMTAIYWEKAINEQFVTLNTKMNDPITVSDFYILASKMMQAYGEPVMNQDEIKALLQVYGSDYPVQLGFEIADAWAYLKVRGCLNVDLVPSGYLDRADLLDICMCIADPDSRTDYKNIDIVLDLGDILRDDGYYPVYDLTFSQGAFSGTDTYDYTKMENWTYLIAKQDGCKIGDSGTLKACNSKDINDKANDVYPSLSTITIDDIEFYVVHASKKRSSGFFIAMVDTVSNKVIPGDVSWIEVPSNCLYGGFFLGGYTTSKGGNSSSKVNISGNYWRPLDWQSGNKDIIKFADSERAGQKVNQMALATDASDATVKELLAYNIDKWFTPMEVEAAGTNNGKAQTSTIKYGDGVSYTDKNVFGSGIFGSVTYTTPVDKALTEGSGVDTIRVGASGDTVFWNRLAYVTDVSSLSSLIKNNVRVSAFAEEYFGQDASNVFVAGAPEAVGNYGRSLYTDINANKNIKKEYVAKDPPRTITVQLQSLLMLYATGANPVASLFEPPKNSTEYVFGADDIKIGKSPTDSKKKQNAEDIVKMLRDSSDVEDRVYEAVKLYNTTVKATASGYEITATDIDAVADLAGACSMSDGLKFDANVASTMVMNRDEQMLFSWEDLVKAGVVFPMTDGGQPKLHEDDGAYYFMTNNGQVKVNDQKHTIQVGTTLYDLAYSIDKSPKLVYIDNEQNGTMYFDIRCVMGIMTNDFVRNDTKTEALRQNLGEGKYVIYDIKPHGIDSDNFTTREVITYNFPEIDENSFAKSLPANTAAYKTTIIGSTGFDETDYQRGSEETGDLETVKYWPDRGVYTRYLLSSFNPTANWITVIDDNGSGIPKASLFVYYPKIAFEDEAVGGGYDDKGDDLKGKRVSVAKPKDMNGRFDDLESKLADAGSIKGSSSTTFKNTILEMYGVTDLKSAPWYVQMTLDALIDLYLMTGRYYIAPDYVVREFVLTDNNATNVEVWDKYAGTESIEYGEKSDRKGQQYHRFKDAGNATGAIYWLDGIGFVYNMPSVTEFSLSKYFSGEYPLPIAYDYGKRFSKNACIVNYNMNFYGVGVKAGNVEGDVIPYGWVLSDEGYIHYTSTAYNVKVLEGYSYDDLPHIDDNGVGPDDGAGSLIYPFRTNDSEVMKKRGMKLAPAGVYFTFGGNIMYNAKVKSISEYNTKINSFYYGPSRIALASTNVNSSSSQFYFISRRYNPIDIDSNEDFYRVWQGVASESWIARNPGIKMAASDDIKEVLNDDWLPTSLSNWLDGLGSNDLITAIDQGASWLILISFWVLPIIGIILMTILVGLSFLADNKVVQYIVDKTIDPIRILTFGNRDIYHWHWKKVLFPCILLYISFALFLNGNIIRVIMFLAKWYDAVMGWARTIF